MFKGLAGQPLIDSSGAPAQTVFSQQRIEAWRPLFTPGLVTFLLMSSGIFCLSLGITFHILLSKETEIDIRYDDQCPEIGECNIPVEIPHDLSGTVILSYRLTNYPQNHNRYISSRSNAQLRGEYVDYEGMSDCGDFRSVDGSSQQESWLLPCGAVALSFFNDTFRITGSENVTFNEGGISWRSDRQKLFKDLSREYNESSVRWLEQPPYNESFPGGQRNEHFIVWMRTATLPTFIKPYAKSMGPIPAGNYTITIGNYYPATIFNGEKHVVLSTVGALGGRNIALGICYMVAGSLLILCGLVVIVSRIVYPRKLGDALYAVPR